MFGKRVGPIRRRSLRHIFIELYALASNTARSLVEVLLSLMTRCIGR